MTVMNTYMTLAIIKVIDMPQVVVYSDAEEILNKYNKFMEVRSDILKVLEIARNEKIIGKSMVARVTMKAVPHVKELFESLDIDLKKVFIVAKFILTDEDFNGTVTDSGTILVELQEGHTCSRCWQIVDEINEDELCERCAEILKK